MEHHTSNSVRTLLVFAVLTPSVGAFGVSSCSHGHRIASASISPLSTVRSLRLMAKKDENENSKGMEDAFRQLEKLKSLDDEKIPLPEWKKQQDDAFAKAIQGLDLKDIVEQPPEPSVESEAELYKNMASELSSKKETDLIDDVKSDLGISPTSSIPQFDPTQRDTDQFMETALDQALEEAEQKANMQIKKESLLDNKEIMKEIEKIFEKANEELLDGLEEMREEQMQLAKDSAAKNAKQSQKRMDDEQERLDTAEKNMKKMLEKVNEETRNVEAAIEDLKNAQGKMEGGVDDKLISLKSGGVIKQATLVGTLLFSLRSVVEAVAYLGGDTTYLMPALVQGAVAVACLVAFLFL